MDPLTYRSEFLLEVLRRHGIPETAAILEVGAGDWRNLKYLMNHGYSNIRGIDKDTDTSLAKYASWIKDFPNLIYDVAFSMSCLFLIEDEEEVKKMATLTKEWLITIEGETTKGKVIGRDYQKVFEPLGFKQVESQVRVFNEFGVLRVFKKI